MTATWAASYSVRAAGGVADQGVEPPEPRVPGRQLRGLQRERPLELGAGLRELALTLVYARLGGRQLGLAGRRGPGPAQARTSSVHAASSIGSS